MRQQCTCGAALEFLNNCVVLMALPRLNRVLNVHAESERWKFAIQMTTEPGWDLHFA